MKITIERKILSGLSVILLFMALLGLGYYQGTIRLLQNSDELTTAINARQTRAEVLIMMDDRETGMRGYVITGNKLYLEPYYLAEASLDQRMAEFSRQLGDAPEQRERFQRLQQLVVSEMATTKRFAQLRETQGFDAAAKAVSSGEGKRQMDGIRQEIAAISQAEDAQFQSQIPHNRQRARQTLWTIGIAGIFSILFIATGCYFIRRDLLLRRQGDDKLRQGEERFRLLVEGAKEYSILMLDTEGRVVTWNAGAQRIKGYEAHEIIGHHFSEFYPREEIELGKPQKDLAIALVEGKAEDFGWKLRKDGSRFWSNSLITPLRD